MDADKPVVPAGRALYDELLSAFQREEEYARSSMADAAMQFAESNKPEDRVSYLIARARHFAASGAKETLTKRAGAMVRLDVKAPT